MNLKYIMGYLDIINYFGSTDVEISSISEDSRKANEGCLFVAIEGFKFDGHEFVEEAINKGAKVVIVEKDVTNVKEGITVIKVKNTRNALAKISSIFYNEPSKKLNLVGVTGTNGKTTVTYFIKSIFECYGWKTGIIGTVDQGFDNKSYEIVNTTPESLDIQMKLFDMVKNGVKSCVMEVSSHALALQRVEYCYFDVGIFTNLSIDHLDYHKTLEEYYKAKRKLFDMTTIANIINVDDEYGKRIVNELSEKNVRTITYGIDNKSDVNATNIVYYQNSVQFLLNTPKGSLTIKIKIPGLFSVYNCLAAAACGYAYGINLDIIKKGLESVNGVKGRFEIVPTNKDFTVIIDFAHTPDGLENVLKTIDRFSKSRKIIVFGAGGDRDKSKRSKMGEIAARYADLCVVTSDNPRTEDPKLIIDDIIKGVKRVGGKYIAIVDRKEAIKYAIKSAKSNDIILLAGKGHESYTIIGNKKYPFDEREIVAETLKEI